LCGGETVGGGDKKKDERFPNPECVEEKRAGGWPGYTLSGEKRDPGGGKVFFGGKRGNTKPCTPKTTKKRKTRPCALSDGWHKKVQPRVEKKWLRTRGKSEKGGKGTPGPLACEMLG